MGLITSVKNIPLVLLIQIGDLDESVKNIPVRLTIDPYDPVEVPLQSALTQVLTDQVSRRVREFQDPIRYLKTLLNFGSNEQTVITNWKVDPNDANKLLVKLLSPLDSDIQQGTSLFISREVANTVIDTVKFELLAARDETLWLRPKNTYPQSFISDTELLNTYRRTLSSKTLASLGVDTTGTSDDIGGYSFENGILRKWYTSDFNSSELNVDYTNYENFVLYGSAELKLKAFRQKLINIRNFEILSNPISGHLSSSVFDIDTAETMPTTVSSGSLYMVQGSRENALEMENIIRSFDGYERFLFYESNVPYSASVDYTETGTEYHVDSTWPKAIDGRLLPIDSLDAIAWFNTQLQIAIRYDENNANMFENAVPTYLLDDENSLEFIAFAKMIGSFFDNIRLYIQQMANVYNRDISATKGLSQDLVWNVAKSFGLTLKDPNSINNLFAYIQDLDTTKKRELTSELWKRFLHNSPYLNRTRGTRESLRALLNIFGLNEQVVGIRETDSTTSGSFQIFDEVTNALNFNTGSHLQIPFNSLERDIKTLHFRFKSNTRETTTLGTFVSGSQTGSLGIRVSPFIEPLSPSGRIEIYDNSGDTIISSSYFDVYTDNFFDVMLRYTGTEVNLSVAQSDGEEILYYNSSSTQDSYVLSSWTDSTDFYLGGSGSLSLNNFNGSVDEVRVWGEYIFDQTFEDSVLNPGNFSGNSFDSAVENLFVGLSFHTPLNLSVGTILNESPYKNKDGVSDPSKPLLTNITTIRAFGFVNTTIYPFSMQRVSRKVTQYTTNVGAYTYGSNKILIAPPPTFNTVSTDGVPVLYRNASIVNNETRRTLIQSKRYVGFFVSPTDTVNNLIIRSLGNVDLKSRIGTNARYSSRYKELEFLQNYYNQFYRKSVNIPRFINFFDGIAPTIFEQASELVPARTILSTGIVIEPNILERKKVILESPPKLSGANTRRNQRFISTEKTFNRDFDITLSVEANVIDVKRKASADTEPLNTIIVGTVPELEAIGDITLNTTLPDHGGDISSEIRILNSEPVQGVQIETDSEFITYEADVVREVLEPISTLSSLEAVAIDENKVTKIESKIKLFDSDIDKHSYINYLIEYEGLSIEDAKRKAIGYKPGNVLDVYDIFGTNKNIFGASIFSAVPPRADFDDYGVLNFFIKNSGIYYFERIRKRIVGEKIYNFLTGPEATWSFGTTYNKNDVVVQDGFTSIPEKYFNGKFFRYVALDAPSKSYAPPSSDANDWVPLYFIGDAVQTPFRVILDTNKLVGDASVETLPITIVSPSRPVDSPIRSTTLIRLGGISANSTVQGSARFQSIASLFSVKSSISNIRIRLYDTAESRDADISRPVDQEPVGEHGVLLDMQIGVGYENTAIGLYPPVTLINNDIVPGTSIYYTIDEIGGETNPQFDIEFAYFSIQAPVPIPVGYLPRHYRFFRDNSTSTKRRNYIGCLQTQRTTTDGRPPVEVSFTAGTRLTVSPNILDDEENLGGTDVNVN